MANGTGAGRWMRSVRRRPAAFVFLLLISATSVATAVLAPLVLDAVSRAALAESVAPPTTTRVVGTAPIADNFPSGMAIAQARATVAALGPTSIWGSTQVFDATTSAVGWGPAATTTPTAPTAAGTPIAVIPGCAGVTITSGRCATKRDEATVDAAVAQRIGVHPGDRIAIDLGSPLPVLTVVGTYTAPTRSLLTATSVFAGAAPATQALLVTQSRLDDLNTASVAYAIRSADRSAITLESVARIRRDVAAATATTQSEQGAVANSGVQTTLLDALAAAAVQQRAAGVIITAVALEALGLAWFAETVVVQRIARRRTAEWGVARLRGLPWWRRVGSIVVEPFVALVAGAVGGAALGAGIAAITAAAGLNTGVPLHFGSVPLLTGALALVGSLVAVVAASIRSARLPLASLLKETVEPRTLSRAALVGQSGIVLVTAVVLYTVVTEQRVSDLTLLTPGLVAALFGIVALRLTVVLVRRGTRKPPRTLGGLVIMRQLARTPSVLTSAVLAAVAVALATYVMQAAIIAVRLQDDRAEVAVGASTVLHVALPAGGPGLLATVDAADPSGTQAMAAEETTGAVAHGASRVVAVDMSRLQAITSWTQLPSGVSWSALRATLAPKPGPKLTLTGTRLRLTLGDVTRSWSSSGGTAAALQVVVQNADGWHTVNLGEVRQGVLDSGPGALPCAKGCRVVSIGTAAIRNGVAPGAYSVRFTLDAMSTDVQSAASLDAWTSRQDNWRNDVGTSQDTTAQAIGSTATKSGRLVMSFRDAVGTLSPALAPTTVPEPLPVIAASGAQVGSFPLFPHATLGLDLSGDSAVFRIADRAPVLPRSMRDGVLVDLALLQQHSDPTTQTASDEVWLAPGAHPQVLARLRHAGVRILSTETLAAAKQAGHETAPTRAAVLGGAVAVAALLLLIESLLATGIVDGSGRARDVASMRAAGLSTARIRRLLALEIVAPTAGGVVVGAIAGVASLLFTVPALPLLAGVGSAPPPDYAPPVVAIAALVVGVLLAVAGVAGVLARIEARPRERDGSAG